MCGCVGVSVCVSECVCVSVSVCVCARVCVRSGRMWTVKNGGINMLCLALLGKLVSHLCRYLTQPPTSNQFLWVSNHEIYLTTSCYPSLYCYVVSV